MKETDYFKVGDIVNMHCGEQGVVVEILDAKWVHLLQCNGHIERAYVNDIWLADGEQNGKKALNDFLMETLGYSSIYEEPSQDIDNIGPIIQAFCVDADDDNIPF